MKTTGHKNRNTLVAGPTAWLMHDGKLRAIATTRVIYALRFGRYPDEPSRHARRGTGGKARQEGRKRLIAMMAARPGARVSELARDLDAQPSSIVRRLQTLAAQGLAASPLCVPGRTWFLTGTGKAALVELAEAELLAPGPPLTNGHAVRWLIPLSATTESREPHCLFGRATTSTDVGARLSRSTPQQSFGRIKRGRAGSEAITAV